MKTIKFLVLLSGLLFATSSAGAAGIGVYEVNPYSGLPAGGFRPLYTPPPVQSAPMYDPLQQQNLMLQNQLMQQQLMMQQQQMMRQAPRPRYNPLDAQAQQMLRAHGYDIVVDGIAGPKSMAAANDFASKHAKMQREGKVCPVCNKLNGR